MSAIHEAWKDEEARSAAADPRNALTKGRIEAVAQTEAVGRRSQNAAKAIEWLSGLGVKVLQVEITRHAAVVRVAHTPFLHKLFANDCAWRQQRQEGNIRIVTWFALRFSTRIEWEEIQCPRS